MADSVSLGPPCKHFSWKCFMLVLLHDYLYSWLPCVCCSDTNDFVRKKKFIIRTMVVQFPIYSMYRIILVCIAVLQVLFRLSRISVKRFSVTSSKCWSWRINVCSEILRMICSSMLGLCSFFVLIF